MANDNPFTKVLVIGDWFVDEHWLVGNHRSPESSRAGKHHTRSLNDFDASIRSLCGAGKVATILANARDDDGKQLFQVMGIGKWYQEDTGHLTRMLDRSSTVSKNHYSITIRDKTAAGEKPVWSEPDGAEPELYNLVAGDWSSPAEQANFFDKAPIGTTRVIRKYVTQGSVVSHESRVDWETRLTGDEAREFTEFITAHKKKTIGSLPDGVKRILIKDHGRGVVSEALIELLHKKYPAAKWYISTKNVAIATSRGNGWLRKLHKLAGGNVRLILIPRVAFRNGSEWLYSHVSDPNLKVISQNGLLALEGIRKRFSNAHIVAVPERMCLIAWHQNDARLAPSADWKDLYVQSILSAFPEDQFSPMASVLFPALVSRLIGKKDAKDQDEVFYSLVRKSLNFVVDWMKAECRRFVDTGWSPGQNPNQKLTLSGSGNESVFGYWQEYDFATEQRYWQAALHQPSDENLVHSQREFEFGIIRKPAGGGEAGEELQFHLWRGMPEVPGFVSIHSTRRKEIQRLLKAARKFMASGGQRSAAHLIIDSPGGGKSYLVRCLAQALQMRMLSFNITQMMSRQDLLHCLDVIGSHKAQNPKEPVIVFFDEINARVDGQYIYDAFLSPLEDGIYVKDGLSFPVGPCFWVFAGTELPPGSHDQRTQDRSSKGSDFLSRLSDRKPVSLNQTWPLEHVYVGVASIMASFPDVVSVSEKVLRFFYRLGTYKDNAQNRIVSFRAVRKLVEQLQSVRFAEVCYDNFPSDWQDVLRLPHIEEEASSEGEMVSIKTQPR